MISINHILEQMNRKDFVSNIKYEREYYIIRTKKRNLLKFHIL